MGIRFQCHHCGQQMHVKDFQAGKKGRCPSCEGRFRIPMSDAEFSLAIEDGNQNGQSLKASALGTTTSKTTSTTSSMSHATIAAPRTSPRAANPTAQVAAIDTPSPEVVDQRSLEAADMPEQQGGIKLEERQAATDHSLESLPPRVQPRALREASQASWYVRPEAGGQYGPAPSDVFWEWLIEGRIGADSLVWRDDWPQWQPASQAFGDYFDLPPSPQSPMTPAPVVIKREAKRRKRRTTYIILISILVVLLVGLLAGLAWVLQRQS